jgi:hypothetical protein
MSFSIELFPPLICRIDDFRFYIGAASIETFADSVGTVENPKGYPNQDNRNHNWQYQFLHTRFVSFPRMSVEEVSESFYTTATRRGRRLPRRVSK